MSIAEIILPEFDHETATTRALLERVPPDKAQWRPHPKSMALGELSMHVATLPRWTSFTLERTEFDMNPVGGPQLSRPAYQSGEHLLQTHDDHVRTARAIIARTSDGEFMVPWTLKNGGRTMFNMPRTAVLRSFVLNHIVHHRGQLSVYLRLLDVPLPSMYGPTADTA